MKKIVGLALVFVLSAVVGGYAESDVTPVKVSLFPTLSVPSAEVVHGLDLGLIASSVQEVQGVQLAFIYGATEETMIGLQSAFVDEAALVKGVQWGFYNGAKDVRGVQLGFINVAEKMQGIQVGLVNVIKKGVIPVMVIVNASF